MKYADMLQQFIWMLLCNV